MSCRLTGFSGGYLASRRVAVLYLPCTLRLAASPAATVWLLKAAVCRRPLRCGSCVHAYIAPCVRAFIALCVLAYIVPGVGIYCPLSLAFVGPEFAHASAYL